MLFHATTSTRASVRCASGAPRIAPRLSSAPLSRRHVVTAPVWVARSRAGDDSDMMGQDNLGGAPKETMFSDADIKQGNIEGSPVQDVVGTEYGEAAQQRSSSSGGGGSDSGGNAPAPAGDDTGSITPVENVKGTGRGDQGPQEEMAQAASSGGGASEGQATGGRFDEEPVPGNHPYDPRPRERGHGIPPHKDASNTHAPSSSQSESQTEPTGRGSTQGGGSTTQLDDSSLVSTPGPQGASEGAARENMQG